ncbi:hypothetical protein NDU88_000829 [Pleurodeles waltl]|uniref:Uncharacterized protein n=1 Tax=Pleurodeles waltl TaxID=8319 RepID=A0AAV7P246_PLEWA|nr:hypothetical protein NDU88_000829 [Pleurodeles waltl]
MATPSATNSQQYRKWWLRCCEEEQADRHRQDEYSMAMVGEEYMAIVDKDWEKGYEENEDLKIVKLCITDGWPEKNKLQEGCRKFGEIKDE